MDYIHSNNGILRGTQTPEENVEASTGTIYIRTTDSTIFQKATDGGTSGWIKNNAITGTNNVVAPTTTVDLNTSGDQALTVTPTKYRITDIVFSEPTTSLVGSLLSGVTGQIYTASGGSGDQCITSIPRNLLDGTTAIANASLHSNIANKILTAGTLYFRATSLLGSNDTVDITVYGVDLS